MKGWGVYLALGGVAAPPVIAQSPSSTGAEMSAEVKSLREDLSAARQQIAAQEARLRALETRLAEQATSAAPRPDLGTRTAGLERVGAAPQDFDRPPELSILGTEGSVVTRRGQLTAEAQFEYARADRNRAVFRGIEVVESVLVGVFDINESRQDVLTAASTVRYGLTDRFEVGIRVPYVYRVDTSILAPVAGSTNNDGAVTIDSSASGNGIGDIELSARYQLASARNGWPFLIANLQAVFPTGTDPFAVRRDELGRALEASTGAGFYGISPSLTAILPTDPAVLFGTIGYTYNIPNDVNTRIPPVQIDRVDPGDAISVSAGLGISLNQRTSFNLGYAHSWAFGTTTHTRTVSTTGVLGDLIRTKSRDLQIGRFLFGITQRISDRASLNWSIEIGATDDATDARTVLRIPLILLFGR
jgi:hypothetical protein